MQPEIRIQILNIDEFDNDFTKFRIHFANNITSVSFEFYNYLDCFESFSERLQVFPVNAKDKLIFQLGENSEKWAYFMYLEVSCEPNGNSVIHVKLDNHEQNFDLIRTEFYLKTLPSSLNKLGKILSSWKPKEQKEIIWISE